MACCGQKRASIKEQQDMASISAGQPYLNNTRSQNKIKDIRFKYVGYSSKTLTGAITSKKYTFRFNGDICQIDERDVPAVTAEPLLQKL